MSAAAIALPPRSNPARGQGDLLRHVPEDTALYALVEQHLEGFLAYARERNGSALPKDVVQEFREYLRCGVLAHGFLRARCDHCSQELFIAFSCKNRGICPSCTNRRMCAEAAHLVDRVLPDVPVRQWVITVPYALRLALAADARALTAVSRIAMDEVTRSYRRRASAVGLDDAETGSIAFHQRFGGSLNLHVHIHAVFIDGAYASSTPSNDEGAAASTPSRPFAFHPLAAPSPHEIADVVQRIRDRVFKWAKRQRRALARRFDAASADADPIAQRVRIGASRGHYATLAPDGRVRAAEPDDAAFSPRRSPAMSAAVDEFNLHAGVTVPAWDRDARERRLRYCARPPFSLARLSVLSDGRVAYRTTYPGPHGHTHRVMDPLEFMARLAALVPPPRSPRVRYAGVRAPNSPHRGRVVPLNAAAGAVCEGITPQGDHRGPTPPGVAAATTASSSQGSGGSRAEAGWLREAPTGATSGTPAPRGAAASGNLPPAPTPATRYVDWASLLRRIHRLDALSCARCGGRLAVIAVLHEPAAIAKVLTHVGASPSRSPPRRIVEPWASDPP